MSKRRNKNKKAGPVKIIRPDQPAAGAVVEAPEAPPSRDLPIEDLSALLASDEGSGDAGDALSESQETTGSEETTGAVEVATADAQSDTDAVEERAVPAMVDESYSLEEVRPAEAMLLGDMPLEESPGEAHGDVAQAAEATATPAAFSPMVEFEDASAELAQAIQIDPSDAPEAAQIASIQIPDSSSEAFEDGNTVPVAWNDAPLDATVGTPESEATSAADAEVEAVAGGKGRKDRKLRLNKLQKHARGAPEPESEAVQPEPVPEPEPVPKAPREPRIPAFAKLSEYQRLSLAHVPGLPEESDVPGHWRGVGFGIGGRRLVSAFDEVVEIIRVPQITHVPGTQPWMLGVANVRGTLLPVVDLKQFLEGERTVMHEGQRVLVVRQSGGNVAVLIDQLFGQRSFNDSQKAGSEAASGSRYDHFIKQFYRVGDNDWGVFSMATLTRTPEFRQAAA